MTHIDQESGVLSLGSGQEGSPDVSGHAKAAGQGADGTSRNIEEFPEMGDQRGIAGAAIPAENAVDIDDWWNWI